MSALREDVTPQRLVRHVFWKYPILAFILLLLVGAVALAVGSPNWRRATIAEAVHSDPGGAVLAFAQELDGTAPSSSNAAEYGMGDPADVCVIRPIQSALPLLSGPIVVPHLPTIQGADVASAVGTYEAANIHQRRAWAHAYDQALGTISPMGSGGQMGGPSSPDFAKVGGLAGDFGPVPMLVEADLFLAQSGYLERYLQSAVPDHSLHLVNIWLYDHPKMLNDAVANGLTDDQWGMVKERGLSVGPWYLAIPAVFHIYFPGGASGTGFVLWNLGFAVLLLFAVPLIPGLRDLPRHLKLYRFIYRYPKADELEQPAMRERHGPVHGGPSA